MLSLFSCPDREQDTRINLWMKKDPLNVNCICTVEALSQKCRTADSGLTQGSPGTVFYQQQMAEKNLS